ncbi:MAG: hypothetical protein ACOCWO_05045 [Candidatus Muiribacteriaceae bacterium]
MRDKFFHPVFFVVFWCALIFLIHLNESDEYSYLLRWYFPTGILAGVLASLVNKRKSLLFYILLIISVMFFGISISVIGGIHVLSVLVALIVAADQIFLSEKPHRRVFSYLCCLFGIIVAESLFNKSFGDIRIYILYLKIFGTVFAGMTAVYLIYWYDGQADRMKPGILYSAFFKNLILYFFLFYSLPQ